MLPLELLNLGKLPNLSVLPYLSCVILEMLLNLFELSYLRCAILDKLPLFCRLPLTQLCDLTQVA